MGNGKMNGVITDIQRFSLNDGPGIRTTVFFKGCNLRCAWCHNPETFSPGNEIMYDPAKCIGCLHCVSVCPTGAQSAVDGKHLFQRELCVKCGKCAEMCFPGALQNTASTVDCKKVMGEILQDKPYYLDSGGGVTLSGGEIFLQSDFADEIISACHQNDIACAVETNLCFDLNQAGPVLRKLDLIMFDLKLIDSAKHKKWTGLDNVAVLKNIREIDKYDIPLIARTPLIPDVTDSVENLTGVVDFLAGLKNLRYYELLNFNPLGEAKYRTLGLENKFTHQRPLSKQTLQKLKAAVSGRGVKIRMG
jgi:pyruvate formate lyase activating enzyme